MKKVFYSLAIFLSIFIINVSTVDAMSCLYTCKNCDDNKNDISFKLSPIQASTVIFDSDFVYMRATSLSDFVVNKEKQNIGSHWDGNASELYRITEENKKISLDSSSGCTKYMYYDQKTGQNKIYFSNLSYSAISNKYRGDIVLELVSSLNENGYVSACYNEGTNKGCNENKGELQELFCDYTSTGDFSSISFSLTDGGTITVYRDYKALGSFIANKDNYKLYELNGVDKYELYLTLRNFWNEDFNWYDCPSSIKTNYSNVGTILDSTTTYKIGIQDTFANNDSKKFYEFWKVADSYTYTYNLNKDSSYIRLSNTTNVASQICSYTRENELCDPTKKDCEVKNYITLTEYNDNGKSTYKSGFNTGLTKQPTGTITIDIPSGNISDSCDNLPVIYTDCLQNSYTSIGGRPVGGHRFNVINCKITTTEFTNSQKLVSSKWNNTQDINYSMSAYNGLQYKTHMCNLNKQLLAYTEYSKLSNISSFAIYDFNGQTSNLYKISSEFNSNCSEFGTESTFTCDDETCKNDLQYTIEKQIRNISLYCSNINRQSYKYSSDTQMIEARKNECESFRTFYDSLIENKIISNIFYGCDVYKGELADKINFFLNIIKIAAPIMAIVLGMLDFGKAVVAADSAKEMKDAGKRFGRRLVATALLFLVPTLLSVLINIFIGDEIDNNPYCGLIDTDNNTTETTTDNSSNIIYDKEDCPGLYIRSTNTCVVPASGGTSSGSSGGISSPNIDRLD